MKTLGTTPSGQVPVLKLPPELALSALEILAAKTDAPARRKALSQLREIPERTLLYAYVLPSLGELRLFNGSLRDGQVTRFGIEIVEAGKQSDDEAKELMGRQLVSIDKDRVGFVEWMLARGGKTEHESRRSLFSAFLVDTVGDTAVNAAKLDRLGKWVGYLIYFRVLRGDTSPGATSGVKADG